MLAPACWAQSITAGTNIVTTGTCTPTLGACVVNVATSPQFPSLGLGMTVGASDILDLANTWTGGTTFSGITENITNTNSSGASRLLDLQAGISGGVSVMSVDTNGITTASQLITGSGVSIAPQYLSGASGCSNGVAVVTFTNGGGIGATASLTVSSGVPGSVTISSPGYGYTGVPSAGTISLCGGSPVFNTSTGSLTAGLWDGVAGTQPGNPTGGKLRLFLGTELPGSVDSSGNAGTMILTGRTASGAGQNSTIPAQGAQAGATNQSGGNLYLAPGIGTGTGSQSVIVEGYPAGTSGNADETLTPLWEFTPGALIPLSSNQTVGNATNPPQNIYLSGSAGFGSGNYFVIGGSPSAARTITLPDANGTMIVGGTLTTVGAVPFVGQALVLTEDANNFLWNDSGVAIFSTTPTAGGTGYVSGDVGKTFTVTTGSGTATGTITAVSGGQVTGIGAQPITTGTGYSGGTGQATTCGSCSGSLLTVNVLALTHFLGIRTSTPVTSLQVSTAVGPGFAPRGIMSAQFTNDANGASFYARKARGTEASPSAITATDTIGSWRGSAFDGSAYQQTVGIDFEADGTIGIGGQVPTHIKLSTGTTATPSVYTEAMRIDSTQNIQIGNGTMDTGIYRDSANTLQVNNGKPVADGGLYGNVKAAVFLGGSATPTATCGTGAGTTPTCPANPSGTDLSGLISITTGTSPSMNATLVTITFGATHPAAPGACIIGPNYNTNTGTPAQLPYVASLSTTGFVLKSNMTPLTGGIPYAWWYVCM